MKKIVWLASWFPTEDHPLTGDFIERHAKAASLYLPIHVFHVSRTKRQRVKTGLTKKVYSSYDHLSASIYYYRLPKLAGIDVLISYVYSLWLYLHCMKNFIKEHGRPDMIHVHVSLRCGLVALYFKWFYKIPFIVTEHYAGYMPRAASYVRGFDLFNSLPLKYILKNAIAVTAVSKTLGEALQKKFFLKEVTCIYNAVDTFVFKPDEHIEQQNSPTFLHISTLTPQKNPEQMFQAFAMLKHNYHQSFKLTVVATAPEKLQHLVSALNISGEVAWHAETTQDKIAALMQHSNALILYSRFESFGCVNIEAIATGTPVIVSDLPVFREYLQDGFNTLFVEQDNPAMLAECLNNFIEKADLPDKKAITDSVQQFSFEEIGKQFFQLYSFVLNQQASIP